MNNKVCFILGAGLGTRMGEIGKKLPKILWPIFEKSLLELQVEKAVQLGFSHIYLNTHYCAELVSSFVKNKKINVVCLHEETLLDSGGAFHNLKKNLPEELAESHVFFVNGDILHSLNKEDIRRMNKILEKHPLVLVSKNVEESNIYNQILIQDNLLKGIIKAEDSTVPYKTYAGIGMVNLSKLNYVSGPSRFFETVANFKKENVCIYSPKDFFYYDFGTKEEYYKNMFNVFHESTLREQLISLGAINKNKLNLSGKSYFSNIENIINLSNDEIEDLSLGSIIMGEKTIRSEGSGLYFHDLFESLSITLLSH